MTTKGKKQVKSAVRERRKRQDQLQGKQNYRIAEEWMSHYTEKFYLFIIFAGAGRNNWSCFICSDEMVVKVYPNGGMKEVVLDDGQAVRRSNRMRYKPLEYWRNERVVYGRRKSGMSPIK